MKRLPLLTLLALLLLFTFGCRTQKETPPDPREQFLAIDESIVTSRSAFNDRLKMENDDRSAFIKRAREFRRKPGPPSNWKFTPYPPSKRK